MLTKLFDGLYLYEIVFLVLGVVVFLVAVVLLVVLVLRNKAFGALLPLFGVSIVMIGYPSIKSIEIKNGAITIEKITRLLRENPTDAARREELKKAVATLAARPITGADRNVTLADAQLALGDEPSALASLQKARRVDPTGARAGELQKRIDLIHDVDRLATALERNPADSRAAAELPGRLAEATSAKFADPKALTSIARAQVAVGERQRASANVDKALAIDPHSQAALNVRARVTAMVPHPPAPP